MKLSTNWGNNYGYRVTITTALTDVNGTPLPGDFVLNVQPYRSNYLDLPPYSQT